MLFAMYQLCFLIASVSLIHGEMIDIKAIDDHYWGDYDAIFMADVTLHVKPAIPAPIQPEFVLKFDKELGGMEVNEASVVEAFNNNSEVILRYRSDEGLPEGDFKFKIQVHCHGEKEDCPTKMDMCFVTPKDQENLCSNHEELSAEYLSTDSSETDPDPEIETDPEIEIEGETSKDEL